MRTVVVRRFFRSASAWVRCKPAGDFETTQTPPYKRAGLSRQSPIFLAFVLAVACTAGQFSFASAEAQTEPANAETTDVQPTADAPSVGPNELTVEAAEKLKSLATDAEQLDEERRAEILDLCDKTIAKLKGAQSFTATTEALQKELDEASNAVEPAQTPSAVPDWEPIPNSGLSADEMRAQLSAADQRVSVSREAAQKIAGEIERRAKRRQQLPEALSKCREQLAKIDESFKPAAAVKSPLLTQSRQLYQAALRRFHEAELKSLEQENRTYESTSRVWLARHDAAEKQLQTAVEQHAAINKLAAEAQRAEAERQALAARRTAITAHPAVKEAAAKNAVLAERNRKLVEDTQRIQHRLREATELSEIMQHRLADVKKRAAAARNTPAIGEMLRNQQDQLPDLAAYRERLRDRPVKISQLGLDIYEWESQRREALHADAAVETAIRQFGATIAESVREETVAELRRAMEARVGILAELISNANDCLSRLEEVDAAETGVVTTTEELSSFVAEQVLWVRSAPTLSWQDLHYVRAISNGLAGSTALLGKLAANTIKDFYDRPAPWALAGLLTIVLVGGRPWVRRILLDRGEAAAKPAATLYKPTIEATLATVFMAAPIPVLCGVVGWRLSQSADSATHAIGSATFIFAAAYAMLDLIRHACRPGGLGAKHFGWDPKALSAIRRAARSLEWLALPLLAVAFGVEIARDEASINAIGRLSLIVALCCIGMICFRLFRPSGALGSALASHAEGSAGARAVLVLAPVATFAVVALIVSSAAGYHYTAMQLTHRAFISCLFVFACLALRSLLMRWLLVAYRRVAMQRAREKRQALLEAQENAAADTPVVETEPHVSLTDINQQARKLVGVGAGLAFLISMWLLWGDILPALGIFSRIELWTSGLASLDPDAGPTFVTLTDVILAVSIFAFTWFAGRNLPGLLEIAVLQRLPLDAGARYAASSVTRYIIMVVGVVLGMRQLGIGWGSVQWLVAAMTVGLGFGLQEIFANFVSGIILLFERPARVGDTVTICEITGTVTKIRIRATTILDWDNRELIVPNREFVTGNLVNWTLSNPSLRLIIRVGVAYGSDTRLATELLYRVARENPHVLDSPEPVVIFNEFGNSSLNFELRVFVSDLSMYRRLKHDLHLGIDDYFRLHNIEIAFPQCDLHVRTLPRQLLPRTEKRPAGDTDQLAEKAA